jgi:hypothetical protein
MKTLRYSVGDKQFDKKKHEKTFPSQERSTESESRASKLSGRKKGTRKLKSILAILCFVFNGNCIDDSTIRVPLEQVAISHIA